MELKHKPSVLVFTDWYLPGFKAGGPISSMINMVEAIGSEVDFWIVCADSDYLDSTPYPHLEPLIWHQVGLAKVLYLPKGKRRFGFISILISRTHCNWIYINGLFSKAFSVFPLLAAKRLGKAAIVAPRGMLAPGALGIKSAKKRAFLKFFKTFGLYRSITFHATHTHEAGHILDNISENAKIVTLPNFSRKPKVDRTRISKSVGELNLLMVARLAPEKNIHFAMEVLSRVHAPAKVVLKCIGPVYDAQYASFCKDLAASLPSNITVEWKGPCNAAEIDDALSWAHLFFLPTLGENYGHSIVEALLAGVPVLISDTTPWSALQTYGLGADFPLGQVASFSDYISHISAMDDNQYLNEFQGVALKASQLVHLPLTRQGYKSLFA